MQLCLGDLGSLASNPISPLQAALATRENSLRVGIDSFWAPLAMFTTQDLALRFQFRERLVLNPEHLPHQGPVLLAPTHRARWDALIEAGEPALRIVATLTGQIRGWLWVSLLEQQGERDVAVIAKAAGIGNPKRIYVMRKQLQGRPPKRFLSLLGRLLEVEARLKRGAQPGDALRDGLLG